MSTSTSFTYDTLIAALQAWCEDNGAEFTTNIQTIVSLGESRLCNDLNFEIFDRIVSPAPTMTINQFVQTIKGANWQGTRSIFIRAPGPTGPKIPLYKRTYSYCADYQPDITATGQPKYYAELTETDYFVTPAPSLAYVVELRQIQPPEQLTAANQNTWLGTNAGDLLLYACLIASENFLQSEENYIEAWKKEYQPLLEVRRLTLRDQIRSQYEPIKPAAGPVAR